LGKSSSFKKKSSTAISSPGADTGLIDLRAASFRLSISASVSRWKCKAYLWKILKTKHVIIYSGYNLKP
jgi:hypothetical protein